eukprot:353563-Chlamydomonas_euryale.AAC.2
MHSACSTAAAGHLTQVHPPRCFAAATLKLITLHSHRGRRGSPRVPQLAHIHAGVGIHNRGTHIPTTPCLSTWSPGKA